MLIVINLCIYHIHRKARKEVCIMEKKPPETLPDAELDVMMALWDIGRPAIVSEIHRAVSKKRKCTKTAVHVLLDRLAGKDFVSIRTIDAPTPHKVVTPLVTRHECGCSRVGQLHLADIRRKVAGTHREPRRRREDNRRRHRGD